MKKILVLLTAVILASMIAAPAFAGSDNSSIGVNVLLNTAITDEIVSELGQYGKVQNLIYEIDSLTMKIKQSDLDGLRALSFVAHASPDAERKGSPVDTIASDSMDDGMNTWNLDAINVTDLGGGRVVEQDGTGVYVAVMDTGLSDSWRQYFPNERIAEEYAISFGGGGGSMGTVSVQPNKWEHDQDFHGTHVTSTILGYSLNGTPVNGVAPNATVIPVKVLNQNGSGWSSVIARGIVYVADLKKGPLANSPIVINMSLGGSVLDPVEQAAIDYAIDVGVIIVASAGNEGEAGMGYPGAYESVISVAAAGWSEEWSAGPWWYALDVADPTNPSDFYITEFSSREYMGQDLDVAAPGSWIVGPYQTNSGQLSYYYLGGTSMASPHVAGIVALMAQKNPGLTAQTAESYLETSALPLSGGSMTLYVSPDVVGKVYWPANATGSGLVDAQAAIALVP